MTLPPDKLNLRRLAIIVAALALAGCDDGTLRLSKTLAREAASGPVTMTVRPDPQSPGHGRSMTFRLPKGYYEAATIYRGEILAINIRWRYPTGEPPGKDSEPTGVGIPPEHIIEARLSPYEYAQNVPMTAADIETGRLMDTMASSYRGRPNQALGERYCGFDVYDSAATPWGRVSKGSGPEIDPRLLVPAPLNHARLFAHATSPGRYDLLVICEPVPPTGWCRAGTSFEGWSLTTYASGSHLCDFPAIVARTQALMRGSLVAGD